MRVPNPHSGFRRICPIRAPGSLTFWIPALCGFPTRTAVSAAFAAPPSVTLDGQPSVTLDGPPQRPT